MIILDKCCCFFRLTTGGLILGWLGVGESIFVIFLTILGLSNVDKIMTHLRNETESYTAHINATDGNETSISIFRQHRELTPEDAAIIERGNFIITARIIQNI